MKNLKYILLSGLFTLSMFSCDNVDFGDINENQNGATEPATSGLLSGAVMSYATLTNRSGLTIPTLYVQYQSQVTYTDEMQYAETPYTWDIYFTEPLQALTTVIDITSDPEQNTAELRQQGHPANQQAVAMILRAVMMKRVTDTYGDVAFSQGFKGLANITPAYDTQESIYRQFIAEVKAARDMIDEGEMGPTGDIIYGGDMASWVRFANSFLLQATLQLSGRFPDPGGFAATEFRAALEHEGGVIEDVDEEAWFKYEDLTGFRNPWNDNRTADYFLSQEFTDALKGTTDETSLNPTSKSIYDDRYRVYVRTTATNPTPDGVPYGYRDESGAGRAQMNRVYYWNATSPLPLLTSAYTYFNRAEASVLGWTTESLGSEELLSMGIEKSFESLENHTAASGAPLDLDDPADYIAARLVDVANVGIEQVIGEEKWVALYGQAFDAWSEFRRTGYPNLQPATDYLNAGAIPTRFLYPITEVSLNNTHYTAGVQNLTPSVDRNTSRVWWDVD